jgi:hypothetical protein
MGIEDPDVDVAEQRASVLEDDDELIGQDIFPAEADPADVAEQRLEVRDEDDYDR